MRSLLVAAVALIVAILLISSPDMIYGSSGEADFPFPLRGYLLPLVLAGLAFMLIAAVLSFALPRRMLRGVASVLVFLALMVALEAYILLPDFGAFTGASVEFSVPPVRYLMEAAAVIGSIFLAWEWTKSPRVPAAILMTGAVVLSAPVLWTAATEQKQGPSPVDEEALFSMGEKNLLVVLLDGFPSDVFEEVIESDSAWQTRLSGFTYYPDTVGVSPTTFLALPSIHSGDVYEAGSALQPFFTEAVGNNSFLTKLSLSGYAAALVNPMNGICPAETECVPAGVVLDDRSKLLRTGAARLAGVSLFRSVPLAMKEWSYDEGRWLLPPIVSDERITDHNVEGIEALDLFAQRLAPGSSQPTAKFVHVLTPHLPVVYQEGCSYSGGTIPATRGAFVTQSACALEAFGSVVDGLKAKGLYDKTAIVLLSDHGQAIPSRKADAEGDLKKLSGWANPLLAVKPIADDGPLTVSDEERWLPQVPSIICGLTGDCAVESVEIDQGRSFTYYDWKNEFWGADSIPVTEYNVKGPPWLAGSWERVGE